MDKHSYITLHFVLLLPYTVVKMGGESNHNICVVSLGLVFVRWMGKHTHKHTKLPPETNKILYKFQA